MSRVFITEVFSRAGPSDHRAREGQTVTLDRETQVTAKVETGFCWKTLLCSLPQQIHPCVSLRKFGAECFVQPFLLAITE